MSLNSNSQSSSTRLVSIDALRGFDMFWIIGGTAVLQGFTEGTNWWFLNAIMPQFDHVPWVGFYFYDLIMPLFLFIVGASMPFSYDKRLSRGDTKKSIYIHMIKRVAILFFLSTITQGNLLKFHLDGFYIFMGTLPAIGVGYAITTIIMLNFKLRGQIIATASLLLSYWAIMMLIPVPGYGAGILTPTVNFATWLDHTIMNGVFPPDRDYTEIATSLTYGCTVMLGMFSGQILKSDKTSGQRLKYLGRHRTWFICHWAFMGSVIPDHQAHLDKFFCSVCRRNKFLDHGSFLLYHRCPGI